MDSRFFCPADLNRPTVELDGSEAHHLINVLRLQRGAMVELFDGRGTVAQAEIAAVGRKSVGLQIVRTWTTSPESTVPVVLATAVPKGDRFRWLVEKATELGVERFVPLRTAHSVVHPASGKLEKLQQTVIAACKQSGRNRLMLIDRLTDGTELIEHAATDYHIVLAESSGERFDRMQSTFADEKPILLCVGPEGGFTEEEIAAAGAAGATFVNLGPRTLRIETAAIALAALVCVNRA